MIKSLGMMIGGIFVGAVAMEIFRRTYPTAMDKVYARTREMASGAKEAFQRGYEGVASLQETAEPAV